MAMGRGFWLDPDDNTMYSVSAFRNRHEWWLLDGDNQKRVHLPTHFIDALAKLRKQAEGPGPIPADKIRLIGTDAGLVRIRDFLNSISIQFSADRSRVRNILWSISIGVEKALKPGKFSELVIQNLKLNDDIRISWKEFKKRLVSDEPILRESIQPQEPVRDIPNSLSLREAVDKLMD